jgi:hypothetical protein
MSPLVSLGVLPDRWVVLIGILDALAIVGMMAF